MEVRRRPPRDGRHRTHNQSGHQNRQKWTSNNQTTESLALETRHSGFGMKRVIDTIEVLGQLQMPEGPCEVCAVAEANYNEETAKLVITLEAFLRTTNLRTKERQFQAEWLPKMQTVCESASPDEAGQMARDVFHRWVRKVRESVPSLRVH